MTFCVRVIRNPFYCWSALSCLLFIALVSTSVHADEVFNHPQSAAQLLKGPLSQPVAALRDAQLMRGNFVYRKYLKELPQPLVSRGEFVFARGLGINWHTREPFDSEFVLTAKGITQRDEGKTTMQVSAVEQPAVKVVARIFLALLSLDVASLQDSFSLSGIQQDKQWRVGLQPTVAAINAVFKDAIVSGSTQVEVLNLNDANGDRTEIRFTALRYDKEITASDRALFVNRSQ
ncbi:MAG: outer membrane lipoprotein carrier protein LolA [Steroidobacteraceae bacterium]